MADETIRAIIIGILVWAALAGAYVAGHERGRTYSWLVTYTGAGIVAVYLLAGTVKAQRLAVPIDWVTCIGIAGLVVLGIGFTTTAVQTWRSRG